MTLERKTRLTLLALKLLDVSANAAPQEESISLFFSQQELQELLSEKELVAPVIKKKASLYLGALFYQSPHEWTLWMNDNRITPEKTPSFICIQNITPHTVTLTWIHEGHSHKITLKPNQSYDPVTQKTREGKL